MSGGEPVFGMLKEVEIILSASTIRDTEIHRFMTGQGELLPSVVAGGDGIGKGGKGREQGGLLDRLRQM